MIGAEARVIFLARFEHDAGIVGCDGGVETVDMYVGLQLLDDERMRRPDDDLGVEQYAALAGRWMRSPASFDRDAIDDIGHSGDGLLDHFQVVGEALIERDAGVLDDRRE